MQDIWDTIYLGHNARYLGHILLPPPEFRSGSLVTATSWWALCSHWEQLIKKPKQKMFLDDLEIVGIFVSLEFASEQHDFFKLFPKSGRQKENGLFMVRLFMVNGRILFAQVWMHVWQIHRKYTWDSLEVNMGFIIACKIGTENLQTDQHSNNNYPKKAGSHKRERLLLQIYERIKKRTLLPR